MMKIMISALVLCSGLSLFASESVSEKANATANDASRSVKKGAHRVQEAVCMKGDLACLAEKAKHRGTEGKDYVKDTAVETKDSVDANSKANH